MKLSRSVILGACIVSLAALALVTTRSRLHGSTTGDSSVPPTHPMVNVVSAQRSSATTELVLPATLQAFQDAPIYARTTGYLARYFVELGDRVKAGQTLATIDSPEIDRQLAEAQANLAQARTNAALTRATAKRWELLSRQNAASPQEAEEKSAAAEAGVANVHALEAELGRLAQLKDFGTVTAPFDGVISARGADVGTLITTDSSRPQLFRVTQQQTLRVYVNVPQASVRALRVGLAADVLLSEFPGRTFAGKVVHIAGALDAVTRTLLAEVQIPNDDDQLYPGMFAQVRFRFAAVEPPLLIPSSATILRANGPSVAIVDFEHTVRIKPVQLGRDFGGQIEIVNGIPAGAQVIANPTDALTEGLVVDTQPQRKS